MSEVLGTKIGLSDGRVVAVGKRADDPDNCTYIWFRNAEGEDLSFRLSPDAADVLRKLLSRPDLSNGRLVAVGKRTGDPSRQVYFWFRNAEGTDLTFRLNEDAADALRKLLSRPVGETPLNPEPSLQWRIVTP